MTPAAMVLGNERGNKMPELPEVEVCRRGLHPRLVGRRIRRATIRFWQLRSDIPANLPDRLADAEIAALERRGKYLLFDCRRSGVRGWLIVHLGMTGSLRLLGPDVPAGLHDHVDLELDGAVLRYHDPRRFGLMAWHEGEDPGSDPLLASLGIEPLGEAFDGAWLHAATRGRRGPIKSFLMDAHQVVGVGNIYAAESLFRAGIRPDRAAGKLGRDACRRLAEAVRQTLNEAIAAGGSSIRDYVHHDGGTGWFQIACAVYGRAGESCRRCGGTVGRLRQGGRTTFFCPGCQR